MSTELTPWLTDRLELAERIVDGIYEDLDDFYGDDPEAPGAAAFAADLRASLARLADLIEQAQDLAEPLELAAGRPPMSRAEAVADMTRRLQG